MYIVVKAIKNNGMNAIGKFLCFDDAIRKMKEDVIADVNKAYNTAYKPEFLDSDGIDDFGISFFASNTNKINDGSCANAMFENEYDKDVITWCVLNICEPVPQGNYCIEKEFFDYFNNTPPYTEKEPITYNSHDEAMKDAYILALEYAQELNRSSRETVGKEACFFEADEDGSDSGNDFVVRCWDGDDYRIVSQYKVVSCDDNKSRSHTITCNTTVTNLDSNESIEFKPWLSIDGFDSLDEAISELKKNTAANLYNEINEARPQWFKDTESVEVSIEITITVDNRWYDSDEASGIIGKDGFTADI